MPVVHPIMLIPSGTIAVTCRETDRRAGGCPATISMRIMGRATTAERAGVVAASWSGCSCSRRVRSSPVAAWQRDIRTVRRIAGRLTGGGPPSVTGTVTAGPVCPVEQSPPDPKCAARPVAGAVIVATDASGQEVGRATSAADGSYQLIVGETGTVLISALPVAGLIGAPHR